MKMSPALTFRWQSGGRHCNQINRQLIQQRLDGHGKKDPKLLSRQHFPVTPRLHQMIYSRDVLAAVKPHARHSDAVAAVQAWPAQFSVVVRVAKDVSMKEQGKLFRQTTMTKMNRCISTEPGTGSKQSVWKLFNVVSMTTINLKLKPLLLNLF